MAVTLNGRVDWALPSRARLFRDLPDEPPHGGHPRRTPNQKHSLHLRRRSIQHHIGRQAPVQQRQQNLSFASSLSRLSRFDLVTVVVHCPVKEIPQRLGAGVQKPLRSKKRRDATVTTYNHMRGPVHARSEGLLANVRAQGQEKGSIGPCARLARGLHLLARERGGEARKHPRERHRGLLGGAQGHLRSLRRLCTRPRGGGGGV